MILFVRLLGVLAALTALCSLSAEAHRVHSVISDVRANPSSGQVEWAHRFSLHDAEHALSDTLGRRVDFNKDPDALDEFGAYVASRLQVTDEPSGDPVPVTLIGSEIERGFIWVYQEAEWPAQTTSWRILFDAFQAYDPEQINTMNLTLSGQLETLIFVAGDQAKTIRVIGR